MKKILFIALLILIQGRSYATQISYDTTWAPNGQVTSVNLNGNFNNVKSVVNGRLDNTNADTTNGYRFYRTVSVLPSSGSQGAVYFLTTDNSLNFDTGSSFTKSISVGTPVTNGFVYYNGSSWVNALFSSAVSGSGIWPVANLGSGTPTSSNVLLGSGAWGAHPYVKVTNTQNQNTAGGASTSGSWQTCILNTENSDTASIASLSSNAVTLPAGTYLVRGQAPAYKSGAGFFLQSRVYNNTAASALLLGTSVVGSDGVTAWSDVSGIITLSVSSAIELQYQVNTSQATSGQGFPSNFGQEVYANIEFTKIN